MSLISENQKKKKLYQNQLKLT